MTPRELADRTRAAETAGPDAEWRVADAGSGRVIVVSAANGLGRAEGGGALVLREYGGARLRMTFALQPAAQHR